MNSGSVIGIMWSSTSSSLNVLGESDFGRKSEIERIEMINSKRTGKQWPAKAWGRTCERPRREWVSAMVGALVVPEAFRALRLNQNLI